MTWKDCPVKCGTLFHIRFEQLMQKYFSLELVLLAKLNMLFNMNYKIVIAFMFMLFCGLEKKILK
jgi:hypothetical protein